MGMVVIDIMPFVYSPTGVIIAGHGYPEGNTFRRNRELSRQRRAGVPPHRPKLVAASPGRASCRNRSRAGRTEGPTAPGLHRPAARVRPSTRRTQRVPRRPSARRRQKDNPMYQYDRYDQTIVEERARQFRGQVQRRIDGEVTENEFKPLRLQNGLYMQLHAYMLRIAVPYGVLSSRQ